MKKVIWLLMVALTFSFATFALAEESCTHSFTDWVYSKDVTCTEAGEQMRLCTKCFKEETKTVASTGHKWGEWKVETGYRERTCSGCGEQEFELLTPIETTTAPTATPAATTAAPTATPAATTATPTATTAAPTAAPTATPAATTAAPTATPVATTAAPTEAPCAHVWSDWKVKTPATADKAGEELRMCGECGAVEKREIPALGSEHTYGEWKVQIDTVKHNCVFVRICSECGNVEFDKSTNAHKYGEWEVTLASTCSKVGNKVRICEACGKVDKGEVAKLPHTEVVIPGKAATCTETGMTDGKKCTVCNEITVKQEVIAALGHKEEILPAKAATCTATGLTEGKKCSVCGKILVAQQEIAKEKHQYRYQIIKPTTERKGYTLYKCKVCGDAYTKNFVDKLPTAVVVSDLGSIVFNGLGEAVPYTAVAEGKVLTIKAEPDADAVHVLSLSLEMIQKFVADGYETIIFVAADHELVIPMAIFTQDMLQVVLKDIDEAAVGYNFTIDCTVADNCTAKMEIKKTDAAVIDVTSVVTGLELK